MGEGKSKKKKTDKGVSRVDGSKKEGSVKLDIAAHAKLKSFCNDNGMGLSSVVSLLIRETDLYIFFSDHMKRKGGAGSGVKGFSQ